MSRLLKVVPVVLLAISAFAQSGNEAQTPSNMTVITPGGTANYVSLFSNKSTIVRSRIVQKNGNVGIGTATPSSPLTVNGTVQSLAGGFIFPDNSVQSSAGLINVNHDSTMMGSGVAASPLGIAVPLDLNATNAAAAVVVTNPYGGTAIYGDDTSSTTGTGVLGVTNNGNAVLGLGISTNSIGVEGGSDSAGGVGVYGYGFSGMSFAGWFQGDVNVTGNLCRRITRHERYVRRHCDYRCVGQRYHPAS